MKLDKIRVENFKSIKALTVNLHDLTCFVGKNESGKSAILEAISFLNFKKYKLSTDYTNKSSSKYNSEGFSTIKGYFILDKKDNLDLEDLFPLQFDETNKAIPKRKLNFKWIRLIVKGDKATDVEVDFILGNNNPSNIMSKYSKIEKEKIKERVISEFLPEIEIFTNDSLTLSPITLQEYQQKRGSYPSFSRLFEIAGLTDVTNISKKPERFSHKLDSAAKEITKLLTNAYKQDESLRVVIQYFGNQFMIKFEDESERSYSLTERSLGFQYFFAFLINKTYLNKIDKKQYIFLLDEPGVSLHPEGARNLINIFEDISKEDQLFYTTHNPFLAFRKKPDNLILVTKSSKKGTGLVTKVYTNKYQILRKELGLLLNDSFLVNDINLVVEGNADKFILHDIIHEDNEFEPLTWLHIFSADTASEIIPSIRYLDSLGLKGVALLDSDKAAKNEIKKPKFKKHILEKDNWSHLTLNEVFKDEEERTVEDMLDPVKYVKAYNEYYKEQKDTIEWKKPFTALTPQKYSVPILDMITPHYKGFAEGSINKIAVLRKFTQLNPYDNNEESYKNLKKLLLVIKDRVLKLV